MRSGVGRRAGTLALTAWLAGCSVQRTPPGVSADSTAVRLGLEAEVRAELERYYGDLSARSWERFADHFWPQATLSTIWRPPGAAAADLETVTVPEFVARAPAGPDSKPIFEERILGADVRVHGNLAQAWARYAARFGDSGAVDTWRGIDAITLMKRGGRWRITSLAFTDWDGAGPGRP